MIILGLGIKLLIVQIILAVLGFIIIVGIIVDIEWNYDLINYFKNYDKLTGIEWIKKYDIWWLNENKS